MADAYHDGMRALQDRFDTRRLADRLVDVTVSETFGEPHRKFIDRASNFFLAMSS